MLVWVQDNVEDRCKRCYRIELFIHLSERRTRCGYPLLCRIDHGEWACEDVEETVR
jgi:hypothetical protein